MEAAVGTGAVIAVFGLILASVAMVIGQLRCTDAAVEAARLIARGERDRAREVVARLGTEGARLTVSVRGDLVTTTVTSPPSGFAPFAALESRAVAVMEPGTVEGATP